MALKLRGTVQWFNNAKGFGFIHRDDGQQDVFVHYSKVVADGYKSLTEGDPVEFELEQDNTGRQQATSVVCLRAKEKMRA